MVVAGEGRSPAQRTVNAIGEAKSGERISRSHLNRLERAREALGTQAREARLLLFGSDFAADVRRAADQRSDVELVDLERLYGGT